jgi:hypothetical protein
VNTICLLLILLFPGTNPVARQPGIAPDLVIATNSTTGLPLDFIYFTALPGNAGAFLQWRLSETDGLQYFVVERSWDGRNFSPLVIVNGRGGQLVYTYKDGDVTGSVRKTYYRVKAVEAERSAFSPVRQLKAGSMNLGLSPNPSSGAAWLQGHMPASGTISIRVVDGQGKVVQTEKWWQAAGAFRKALSLHGLSAGMYWMQVSTGSGEESVAVLKHD